MPHSAELIGPRIERYSDIAFTVLCIPLRELLPSCDARSRDLPIPLADTIYGELEARQPAACSLPIRRYTSNTQLDTVEVLMMVLKVTLA